MHLGIMLFTRTMHNVVILVLSDIISAFNALQQSPPLETHLVINFFFVISYIDQRLDLSMHVD